MTARQRREALHARSRPDTGAARDPARGPSIAKEDDVQVHLINCSTKNSPKPHQEIPPRLVHAIHGFDFFKKRFALSAVERSPAIRVDVSR